MEDSKILAIAMVAMMACAVIPFSAMDGPESDADSATSYGFKFWINYGDGWSGPISADGYDACIALQNYATADSVALTIDSATYTTQYGYKYINTNYGDITTIGSKTEDGSDVWTTIYYPATGSAWTLGSDALGYYKPFADYDSDHQTANIALYYGTTAQAQAAISSLPTSGLRGVVQTSDIIGNADYAVSFYLKVDSDTLTDVTAKGQELTISDLPSVTKETLLAGQTITGYGSDLYLAFKNAVGSNISAVEAVPGIDHGTYMEYYSWMYSLFGLGTVLVDEGDEDDWSDDIYAWWTQYTSYSSTSAVVSDFVLGYYSPLSGAPNTQTSYALVYSEGNA